MGACDPMLAEVFELCTEAAQRTDGWFDPQVSTHGGRLLDPAGIVKGWAVQGAGELLSALGGCDHYINAAGDITMLVGESGGRG